MQTLCLMLTSFKSVCMIVSTRLGVEYIEQIKELYTFIYIHCTVEPVYYGRFQATISWLNRQVATLDRWISV